MGFLDSIFGGGGADVSRLQRKQAGLINRGTNLYDTLLGNMRSLEQQGAWDPNAQLDLLKRDHAYATGIATGNSAAAARTLGYRPGDTAPLQATKALGERASLDYDQLANGIRNQANQGRLSAWGSMAGVGGGLLGQGISAYGDQINQGLAQQAQSNGLFASLLGTTMPFLEKLPPFRKKAPSTPGAS